MVDSIKQKYGNGKYDRSDSIFREEREEKKSKCNSCIITYAFMTLMNTSYFIMSIYLYNKLNKYTDNDILNTPESANYFFNNINSLCNSSSFNRL
jgi:hypothetical protein